jgi:hypothetical protein
MVEFLGVLMIYCIYSICMNRLIVNLVNNRAVNRMNLYFVFIYLFNYLKLLKFEDFFFIIFYFNINFNKMYTGNLIL